METKGICLQTEGVLEVMSRVSVSVNIAGISLALWNSCGGASR